MFLVMCRENSERQCIIYSNLNGRFFRGQALKQVIGTFNTFLFLFFFVVLELNAFVKGAIEGFLSSLALLIFFAILPLVSMESIFQARTQIQYGC